MDADSDHGGHERAVFFRMDHHAVQAIIVEDPGVDPFRCGTLAVDFFIGVRAARDIGVQVHVPFEPGLDDPAVFRRSTAVFTFGTMVFSKRTPPHEVAAGLVIAVGGHVQFFLAEGRPILVNGYRVRDYLGPPAFIVEVDKCPDLPVFQEAVSGVVVHGGVEAYVLGRECGHMLFQFMESNEETDGIMPLCACEAQEKRHVGFQSAVITGELGECIAEVMLFKVAVPSQEASGSGKWHRFSGTPPWCPRRKECVWTAVPSPETVRCCFGMTPHSMEGRTAAW